MDRPNNWCPNQQEGRRHAQHSADAHGISGEQGNSENGSPPGGRSIKLMKGIHISQNANQPSFLIFLEVVHLVTPSFSGGSEDPPFSIKIQVILL